MSAVLAVEGLGKAFAGRTVLEGVTLEVQAGEMLGLIGPNGAGKTTLFDIVTGFVRADAGCIRFMGRRIGPLSPEARVRLGLVRSFQRPMVFPAMTLHGNVALAARAGLGAGVAWLGRRAAVAAAADRAAALVAASPLAGQATTPLAGLSYGERRMADVLVALALCPRLLLLDEPTAGLSPGEAAALLDLVRRLHPGATLLIAHDLDVVFGRCDRVAVLGGGRLLCCAAPDVVRADAAVGVAYLGPLAA